MHCTNVSEFQLYSEALTFLKFLSPLLIPLRCLQCMCLPPEHIAEVVDGGQALWVACVRGRNGGEGTGC